MPRFKKLLTPAAGLVLAVGGLGLLASAVSCSDKDDGDATKVQTAAQNGPAQIEAHHLGVDFIGAQACAQCHEEEHDLWVGSHHEEAMKLPTQETVLGDFDNATFEHFGTTSRFFTRDGKYYVNTDGPDGEMADFEIAYTFGLTPLQQYLIRFPDGKVQALTIAWDSRTESAGGQRWMHLYPDEAVPHDDALHWAGANFTWNHMCAECHSTDLQKNYDYDTGVYNTTWAEINVSCEACHGPGQAHADWAAAYAADESIDVGDMGLVVQLKDETRDWIMNGETGIAERRVPLENDTLIDACARCHSRRSQISNNLDAGVAFLDNYRPSYLTEGLYFADGQIQDEVYVWGSFVQSKMHMAGVTCIDCHDPHTAQVATTANALCAGCHAPARFDTYEHFHHPPDSDGASCVNCHMPHRTYMQVDDRRDHSLRIPRPDLSVTHGTPNACNACHTEQDAQWAADAAAHWWGVDLDRPVHYGEVFTQARAGVAGVDEALLTIMRDPARPPIVRGTAVIYLARYPTRRAAAGVFEALTSDVPLVRLAATDALINMPPQQRVQPALDLLDDPLRAIRIEAGNALADIPTNQINPTDRERVAAGIQAYREAQLVSSDTAAANMNLGNLAYRMGDIEQAKQIFERALQIDPTYYPAYSNLASIHTEQGDPARALALLQEGLTLLPNHPDLIYTTAMTFVRQRNYPQAIALLRQANATAPQRSDIAYAYAVALHQTGNVPHAFAVLEQTLENEPNNTQVLLALAAFHRDARQFDAALGYARRVQTLMSDDPGIAQFVQQLELMQR